MVILVYYTNIPLYICTAFVTLSAKCAVCLSSNYLCTILVGQLWTYQSSTEALIVCSRKCFWQVYFFSVRCYRLFLHLFSSGMQKTTTKELINNKDSKWGRFSPLERRYLMKYDTSISGHFVKRQIFALCMILC